MRKTLTPAVYGTRDEFVTPFSTLFDRILEHHFPEFKEDYGIQFSNGAYPKVDVIDHDDSVEIIAEVAGWKKEDINIDVEKGILKISSQKVSSAQKDESKYIFRELKRSSFQRTFQLGDKLDENQVQAKFQDGILKITIQKKHTDELPAKKVIAIE